jgi:hypothetical protein
MKTAPVTEPPHKTLLPMFLVSCSFIIALLAFMQKLPF